MSLVSNYKQANRAYKESFEFRYCEGIKITVDEIINKYGIEADSNLAHIVENALTKFLVALEKRRETYKQWHQENHRALESLEDQFGKAMHSSVFLMLGSGKYQNLETGSFIKLARIDRGRSNVVLNTVKLIARHQDGITDSVIRRKSDPTSLLLGSVIRRAINLYYEVNGKEMAVTFSNSPKEAVAVLGSKLGICK